jgi:hypothetical protein
MSKVVITADKYGNMIGVYQNSPEYGYIRVEQHVKQINDQGWLKLSKRSAFIKGLVKDLETADFKPGMEIPGKIIIIESLTPFNTENPDRDLKIAGATGIPCTLDDQAIYRQSFYTTNESAVDQLIMHNNSDDIKNVQAAQRQMSTLRVNKNQAVEADLG